MKTRLTAEDLAKAHDGLCGVSVGDGSCSCLVHWVEALQKEADIANLQNNDARALIGKCREVVDDELENRSSRHSLGRLYAELARWLDGQRVELCKHGGQRLKTSSPPIEACKECGSVLP